MTNNESSSDLDLFRYSKSNSRSLISLLFFTNASFDHPSGHNGSPSVFVFPIGYPSSLGSSVFNARYNFPSHSGSLRRFARTESSCIKFPSTYRSPSLDMRGMIVDLKRRISFWRRKAVETSSSSWRSSPITSGLLSFSFNPLIFEFTERAATTHPEWIRIFSSSHCNYSGRLLTGFTG